MNFLMGFLISGFLSWLKSTYHFKKIKGVSFDHSFHPKTLIGNA
jgi:hypothetical protein